MRLRRILALTGALAALGFSAAPAQAAGDWTLGGESCKLIPPASAAAPIGTGTCPGVRPGAVVRSDKGQCTFNFLFTGADGQRYVGTAGHCILGESQFVTNEGEESWAPGMGPVAKDSRGNRIGEFAYAILEDPKDFALVRLDPGVAASPEMCHFGGPTGVNSDRPAVVPPTLLQYFGNGVAVGSALPARTALALGMPDPDHVFANGVALPGDSGGGVVTPDGRAVGVVVTIGVHTASVGTRGVDAGLIGITRLGPQVTQAEGALDTTLTLQTAAVRP